MRAFASVLALGVIVACPGITFAADAACALITQDQLSKAMGTSMGAGTPISSPQTCQWAGKGKIATLTITQPQNGMSAVDRFNAGKTGSITGVQREPVSGVGDDAYYVYFAGNARSVGIVVRKGSAAFEVRVYGFDLDAAKAAAKTVAHGVAEKL